MNDRSIIAWKPAAPTPELASARLRCFRPCEYLNRAGWRCELFDPAKMDRYRIVVFQKSYDENDLAIAHHLRAHGVRTVFDLCDNHFVGPPARAERLRRMIDIVDAVTVATPELAKRVGRESTVIDDALDDAAIDWRWSLRRWWPHAPLRLVWFGNAGQTDPPFGLIDLARIVPHLEALHTALPIRLTVISNSRATFDQRLRGVRFPVNYHEWNNRHYPRRLQRYDLCLIPVSLNPFTVCKSVNRLALALLLGLAVVADAIPSYEELRPYALMCDWDAQLAAYASNRRQRRRDVSAGRAYLKAKYTPRRVTEQWSAVFRQFAA